MSSAACNNGRDAAFPGLDGRTLLFIHMPKAAGTSFRDLLARRLSPAEVLSVGDPNTRSVAEELVEADRYTFVHGHFSFAVANSFSRLPFLFTVLRDPIERAISAFYFMQQQSSQMEREAAAGMVSPKYASDFIKAREMTLPEFIRYEPALAAWHLGNVQVELLSCPDIEKRSRHHANDTIQISAKDVDLARARLAIFDAFGLAERLPESINCLAHALKTRPFGEMAWCNKTRSRPTPADLDPSVMDELQRLTEYDKQLYEFAAELFELRLRKAGDLSIAASAHAPGARPSLFEAGTDAPGEGWYAAERIRERWFHWTGPGEESWIDLGTPEGSEISLRIDVQHALLPGSLHELEIYINGTRLQPGVALNGGRHVIAASVPPAALRGDGTNNRVTLRVPHVMRPCDCHPDNNDSRKLGIAVHAIGLYPTEIASVVDGDSQVQIQHDAAAESIQSLLA